MDDMTGLEWQKVKASVWIEPGHLLNSVEPIWDIARHSYDNACSVCHRQPQPASHDANQWPGLLPGWLVLPIWTMIQQTSCLSTYSLTRLTLRQRVSQA